MADLTLDGLASGIPTQEIINQLIAVERRPMYDMQEKKSNLERSKNAWRDINSRIDKLETKLTDLKLSSTFDSNKTTSTDKEVVTASAGSEANAGSYEVEVIQTAEAQRISGKQLTDAKTEFQDIFTSFPASSNIMLDGQSIEVEDTDTLTTLKNKINESGANINASIVDSRLVLDSSKTGTKNELALIDNNNVLEELGVLQTGADDSLLKSATQDDATTELGYTGSFKLTAGGSSETIDIVETDSLNNIKDKLNSLGSVNVSASISGGVLTIDETNGNEIKLESTSASDEDNIIQQLKLGNKSVKSELQGARNAEIKVNGITGITSQSNSFEDVVNGVSFNIDSSLDILSGDPTESAIIEVSKDVKKATSAIQNFVDQYNSVQDFISNKIDYDSETDVAGALQGDNTLIRLQSNLRRYVTDVVDTDSNYDQLGMVGITVDKQGIMQFDSSKFKEAIQDSPEKVKQLFKADTENNASFDGVATRLDGYLNMLIQSNTGVIPEKIDSYEDIMENIDEDIESLNERLEMRKENLLDEFTAMETAISKMNSQMSWMQSQIGSMGGTSSMLSSMM